MTRDDLSPIAQKLLQFIEARMDAQGVDQITLSYEEIAEALDFLIPEWDRHGKSLTQAREIADAGTGNR